MLKPHDGKLLYSSISPRIFEAAALKTPQILFPGWYNELIEPGVHYFELKKDFSNFEEMVKVLKDDDFLSELAENAYRDLIASKLHNQDSLGFVVNEALEERWRLNSFETASSLKQIEHSINEVEKKYKTSKALSNFSAEITFGIQHFLKVINNPRYRGFRKFKRLYEIFLRYCTHLKPRLIGS